jgi:secreted trypsin-like serine protease
VIRGSFSSFRIHPDWDYDSTKYDADIAVLVLKNKITYGPYIQPACLPAPSTSVFNIRGTVVGYGLSENSNTNEDRPKFVEIPSIDNEKCLWNSPLFYNAGSERAFCAGERGKNPCRGDSGSGFYVQHRDTYTVNGLVSAGAFNCSASQYVVFTNVPKFVDWIRQEMAREDGNEEQGDGITLNCEFGKASEL